MFGHFFHPWPSWHHMAWIFFGQGIRPTTHRCLGGWKPGFHWLDSIRLAAEGGEWSIPARGGEAAQADRSPSHPNCEVKNPWNTMKNHGLIGDEPWWYDILGPSIGFLHVFNIRGMRIVDMLCSCCQQLSVTCSFSGGPGGRKTASPWRWRNRLSRLEHAEPHFEKNMVQQKVPLGFRENLQHSRIVNLLAKNPALL